MDVYLLIYNVLWTLILIFPSLTEQCGCLLPTSGPRSNVCVENLSFANGDVCYRNDSHAKCALVTCHYGTTAPKHIKCIKGTGNAADYWDNTTYQCPNVPVTTKPPITANPSVATTSDADGDSSISTTNAKPNPTSATSTIPPTSSNSSSTNTTNTESTSQNTSTDDKVTSKTAAASQDDNTVIYASASAGIFIVIVIVILIVLLMRRRRKTQKDESNGIKRQPHGAISNNSYHNAAMNENTIPMNDLTRTPSENRYTDIYDDKPMVIDTFDDNYNTVALPSESKNEYGNIKPVAEPFVDNTYSHISNPNHLNMGTLYSHIGSALGHQQEKQPDFAGDTYAHIGQGNGKAAANGKNKQDTFVSDDTYSHIGKDATVSKTTKKTAEVDDTYSHLGQNVNQHPKMPPNADVDATYNTLGSSTNGVGTQNRPKQLGDDNDNDSEYNHLEFGMKSATKQNQFPRKDNNTKIPDKNLKQNTAAFNLYAQVVKKKNGKFGVDAGSKAADKVKANGDNERGQRNKFVVMDDDANIAEETENEPTNHQYFVLEKHERET